MIFSGRIILFSIKLYSKHLADWLLSASLFYTIFVKAFGHISCYHNSSLRNLFISDICMLGSDFVIQQPFPASVVHDDHSSNYSYYPWLFLLIFAQGLLSQFVSTYFRLHNCHYKVQQLELIKEDVHQINAMVENFIKEPQLELEHIKKLLQFYNQFLRDKSNENCVRQITSTIILSLITLVSQVYILQWTFNGQFIALGKTFFYNLVIFNCLDDKPLQKVFPNLVSCRLPTFGPSGSLNQIASLCSFNLNLINTYIFLSFWFIYCFLALILLLALIQLIFLYGQVCSPSQQVQIKQLITHAGQLPEVTDRKISSTNKKLCNFKSIAILINLVAIDLSDLNNILEFLIANLINIEMKEFFERKSEGIDNWETSNSDTENSEGIDNCETSNSDTENSDTLASINDQHL